MSQSWKWSLREALSIIWLTYADDWGRGAKERNSFLQNPKIQPIEHHYITGLQSGEGEKTVIFLHGSPGNAVRWSSYLKNVPDGYHYISIDRMGYGERANQKPDLEKDTELLSDYISQFKKPILVAHSLAGAIVLRLAAQNDIGGLVLAGCSLDPSLEEIFFIQKIAQYPPISWLLSRSIRHSNIEMPQLKKFMQMSEAILDKVTVPIQMVHAKDDGLVPHENITYAKSELVNAQNITVTDPDTGRHALPWSHPEIVQGAIQSLTVEKAEAA